MAKNKVTESVIVCDVCGKTVSDRGKTYYGGHPFDGFITVTIHDFSTSLRSLERKKIFDFCDKTCLFKHYGVGKIQEGN